MNHPGTPRSGDASPYRADIDGLRAVAVLAVVVYHARAQLVPGGFVGVDVFFVISGFLISGIIFARLDGQIFSLLDFYRRRVQRIAPALFVVVAATLAAAYWLFLPSDSADVARSSAYAVASLANVYFWLYRDQGYFAEDSRELPLLHLWSLGVEEQFYLVWPLVLLAVGRAWRSRAFVVWSAVAAVVSFGMGDLLYRWDPSFVYYLMPTRAGELLVGAIVSALVAGGRGGIAEGRGAGLGLAGAVAVGASLFLYDDATVFPGVRAMLPTLGTAALLLAGSQSGGGPVTRLLASKPFVAVGLISYSVYLWHWPLMAFYRYGYGELSPAAQWALPILSLIAGAASYALVEQPTRRLKFPALPTIVFGYGVPAAVIAAASILIVYGPRLGIPLHDEPYLARLTELSDRTRPAFSYDYVCQKQQLEVAELEDPRCIVGARTGQAPRVLVWGDSNAAHYIGVLGRVAEREGFDFRNLEIGACPPVVGDLTAFVDPRRLRDCQEAVDRAWPSVRRYPVVVLGASWTTYDHASPTFFPALIDTVNRLVEQGSKVILLGKMPIVPGYDRRCPEKRLTFPRLSCDPVRSPLSDDIEAVNARLKELADRSDRIEYFDMTPYLCREGSCSSADASGEALYYDPSHISMAASWKLGAEILETHGVPPALAALAAEVRARE